MGLWGIANPLMLLELMVGRWEKKGFCSSGKEHELDHEVDKKKINPDYCGEYTGGKRAWGLVKKLSFVKSR